MGREPKKPKTGGAAAGTAAGAKRTSKAKVTSGDEGEKARIKLDEKFAPLVIRTPVDPELFKKFEPSEEHTGPAEDLLLSEYIAAVRREIEAVSFIAAPQDKAVPNFHVSEVELELVCAVSEVSDGGLRVTVDSNKLKDTPENMLQKVKLKLTDPVVMQLQQGS